MSGFFAGGNKSLSFGPIGTTHMKNKKMGGKIVSISEPQNVTKFGGNEVIPGAAKVIVTLSTWEGKIPEQAQDAEDKGIRDLHVQFRPATTDSVAISRALKEAGVTSGDMRVGDELYLEWVDHPLNEQNPNARYKNAWYFVNADAGQFGQQQMAPAAPTAQQFAPQQPQAPAPPQFQQPAAQGFASQQQAPAAQGGFMQQAAPAPQQQFAPPVQQAPAQQWQQPAPQQAAQGFGGPPQAGFPPNQGFGQQAAPQPPAQQFQQAATPQAGPVNPFAGQQQGAPDPFGIGQPPANASGFAIEPPF